MQKIRVDLPVSYRARIVDSDGFPLATSEVSTGLSTLNFFPAPFARMNSQVVGNLQISSAQPGFAPLAADEIGYTLEIILGDAVDSITTEKLSLSSSAELPFETYLPLNLK
jgi:hypothetical protein